MDECEGKLRYKNSQLIKCEHTGLEWLLKYKEGELLLRWVVRGSLEGSKQKMAHILSVSSP